MSVPSPLWGQVQTLLPIVPAKDKRRFLLLLLVAICMAGSELALTGLVALLAAVFASPEAVLQSGKMVWLRQYVDIAFVEDFRLLALAVLCFILLIIILKGVLTLLQQRQLVLFSESVAAAARLRVFRFYQRAPFLWVNRTGVADLQFGMGATSMLSTLFNIALQIATNGLTLLILFIGLFSVSPLPSLFFLLAIGLGGGGLIKLIRQFLDRCARDVFDVEYRLAKISHLALHGLKEMRLYVRENMLFEAFQRQMARSINCKARQQSVVKLPVVSLEILGFATLVGVMCFLVFGQDASMVRISGTMGFLAATAWRALPVANRLVEAMTSLRGSLPYLQKTKELLDLEQRLAGELLPLLEDPPLLPFVQMVELDCVSFHYPDAENAALCNVSMSIPAGSMVGLVGLSGAGKSTLVNILTGLLPPESGRVLVDGTPLNRDNNTSWLKRIGYVAQAPYILDATLAENVALSRWGEEIDRSRVLECCRMAALDFLEDLEDGIDTVLGDRGTRLSGGQAQRVAIARALYSDPALIIFDEATSALDMKNEKAIHETILSLRNSVTMVVIAHRLTTIEGCDSLVWMERGRVIQSGTAEDILPLYMNILHPSRKDR